MTLSVPASEQQYRARAPIVVGHRVSLDANEWDTVEAAIEAGHERYVATACFDAERIVFVKNRWSDGWVLPGGKADDGEPLPEAAARELREETGIKATVGVPLAWVEQTFAYDGATVTGELVVFASSASTTELGADLGSDGGEIDDAAWFDGPPDRLDGIPNDLLERLLEEA